MPVALPCLRARQPGSGQREHEGGSVVSVYPVVLPDFKEVE